MGADLHNLNAVVDTLAPVMVGMPSGGGRWVDPKFPGGEPVIQIIGDRATGKTALINALYDGYHHYVPTARVYLTESPYSAVDPVDREGLDTSTASPVTNLLFTLSHELKKERDKCSHALVFPRLSPALLVLTAWRPEVPNGGAVWPANVVEAEQELRDLLAQQTPDPQALNVAWRRWLNVLPNVIAGLLPPVPGLEGFLQAAMDTLLDRRADTPRWTWWRSRLAHIDGDAVQRLFGLVQEFRARGPNRAAVEAHLIAALLADINGSYRYWARRTQHPPLILLDDVDKALHQRFLEPFVTQYETDARQWKGHGRVMLPVVFATSLGDGSAPKLTTANVSPWTSLSQCPPQKWLLKLGIPRLTDTEIRTMLTRATATPSLPVVIDRLSGGRAGSALLLAEAAAEQQRGPDPFVLDQLLSPSVVERLLEQLLPDSDVRDQVLALAPALDEAAAAALFRPTQSGLRSVSAELRVRQLLDFTLEQSHWNHRPWPETEHGKAPLVSDRALRAILLHQLRTKDGGTGWSPAHTGLAHHYNPGQVLADDSVRHDPRYLHHALALGQFDTLVVRAMHYRYLRHTPAEWLRDLNLVAAAPQALGGFPPEAPPGEAEVPACPDCAERGAPDSVHTAIRQLLATVWRLSAPMCALPSRRGIDMWQVEIALRELCTDYGHRPRPNKAYNAYVDAIAEGGWIDALVNGVQAPDLPVNGR